MKKEVMSSVYIKNGEEIAFAFYTSLRATDKIKFVNTVVNTLVGESYNSLIRDLIFDYIIIRNLTDVDTTYIDESPNSIDLIEDLLDETNIVKVVRANASELIEELEKAVDENIEYKTGIHKNSFVESLAHLLGTLEKKISTIDTEEMMKAAQVLGNLSGEINAQDIFKAYGESDLFKERFAQIAAEREKHNSKIDAIKSEEEKRKANKANKTKVNTEK